MLRWYAVHTQAKAENKAAFHLRNQGFEVFLPQYAKQRRHARRVDWTRSPLFPRYLFVRLDTETARWRVINSTVGVCYLVSHADQPAVVPDSLIVSIRAREDEDGLIKIVRPSLHIGEKVKFVSGPMLDRVGIFSCLRDDDRVIVLLELLGRPIEIAAERDAIAAFA